MWGPCARGWSLQRPSKLQLSRGKASGFIDGNSGMNRFQRLCFSPTWEAIMVFRERLTGWWAVVSLWTKPQLSHRSLKIIYNHITVNMGRTERSQCLAFSCSTPIILKLSSYPRGDHTFSDERLWQPASREEHEHALLTGNKNFLHSCLSRNKERSNIKKSHTEVRTSRRSSSEESERLFVSLSYTSSRQEEVELIPKNGQIQFRDKAQFFCVKLNDTCSNTKKVLTRTF